MLNLWVTENRTEFRWDGRLLGAINYRDGAWWTTIYDIGLEHAGRDATIYPIKDRRRAEAAANDQIIEAFERKHRSTRDEDNAEHD